MYNYNFCYVQCKNVFDFSLLCYEKQDMKTWCFLWVPAWSHHALPLSLGESTHILMFNVVIDSTWICEDPKKKKSLHNYQWLAIQLSI